MIVVSDTTPLNYLVLIEAIGVLPSLFDAVYVPPSVIAELTRPKTPEAVRDWAQASHDWLTVVAPTERLASMSALGAGEADALSLAKELQISQILIDERRGTNVAMREGLVPLPTLAILERAAADRLIDLRATLQKLTQTNFRVPPELLLAALERDAARKRHS